MTADLTRLPAILRAAGLTVVEIPGWLDNERPGSFDPRQALVHHTGSRADGYGSAKAMADDGRPDLKPPLVQTALDRKGVWYLLAAGRANHAGRCKPVGGLQAYPGRAYGDGNAQMMGVECMNDGVGEPWPDVQYSSLVIGLAAITRAYDFRAPLGHKETSLEGKPDPHGINMNTLRSDVAAVDLEDDMPLKDEDYERIADAVWQKQLPVLGAEKGRTQSAAYQLTVSSVGVYRLQRDQLDPVKFAKALQPLLAPPGESGPVTDDQLERALRKVFGSLAVEEVQS